MGKAKKVLLVDDSKVSRLMLKAIIENQFPRWQVLEAENAAEALKISLYENENINLITLDMNMPETDGLTVAPQLRRNCTNAKVALLTGNMAENVRNQAKEQGLLFIAKPITEEKIVTLVQSHGA